MNASIPAATPGTHIGNQSVPPNPTKLGKHKTMLPIIPDWTTSGTV